MGADFDSFIDEILELVGPVLIEEEIALPDFVEQFEQGVIFVKLHGSAKLYNGTFNALEKIKRTGNSSFARNENNDLDISTTVTIDKARIHYSQSIEFQGVRMNSHRFQWAQFWIFKWNYQCSIFFHHQFDKRSHERSFRGVGKRAIETSHTECTNRYH